MRLAMNLHLAAGDARALYRALLDQLFTRHPDWELSDGDWRYLGNPVHRGEEFSAYIGSHLPPEDMRRLAAQGIPCVFIGNPPQDASLPPRIDIDYDNPAFGRQAAELLLGRGWRSFAFFGDDTIRDSCGRLEGFREGLSTFGVELTVFNETAGAPLEMVAAWLRRLPLGTVVLARSDHAALRIVAAARAAQLAIPEHLGLLGIDDDDIARARARLDLASLRRDDVRIASLAFDLLELQIAGELVVPGVRRIGPHPQSHLGTTIDPPRHQGPVMQRALVALHGLPMHLLDPQTLAHEAGCSRRTLERIFAREWHESPADAVRRVRMEQARRLCAAHDASLTRIARTLGFNTVGNFIAAYRRYWGNPPRHGR